MCVQAVLRGNVAVQLSDGNRQPEQQRESDQRPFQPGECVWGEMGPNASVSWSDGGEMGQ